MRYNIFYLVHKGLKALLYETALQVQHTDFWNVEQGDDIVKRIDEVVALFEKHAATEDHFVLPAIAQYEPAVVDAFEQEHEKDHELGENLVGALLQYTSAPVITAKAEAGRVVQIAFLKFMVFNLDHMMREEDILNSILWRYYNDEELHGITRQIVAHIPPDAMSIFSKWMLRGLNTPEITGWMKEVERSAPDFVFKDLFATAERELSRKRFREVVEGLTEGAMLA